MSFLMGVSKLILPVRTAMHSLTSIAVTAQKTGQGQHRPYLVSYAIAWQGIALHVTTPLTTTEKGMEPYSNRFEKFSFVEN